MVGALTPRTIAAKRDGTEAFPAPLAASPRGDRLRALTLSSLTGTRADIGRGRRSVGLPWGATTLDRGPAVSFPGVERVYATVCRYIKLDIRLDSRGLEKIRSEIWRS